MAARRHAVILVALLAACAEGEAGDPPTVATERPTPSPTTAASPEDEAATPVAPSHGATYWAVYLSAGDESQVEDAITYLSEERGIDEFAVGDVECDVGAREALGPGAGPLRVAVYFEGEEEARAWAETLPAAPRAIAEVRTLCLD